MRARYLLLVVALMLSAACTHNDVNDRSQFNLISLEQEVKIGSEAHKSIVQQYGGVYKDPVLAAYVNEVGQRLAAVSERKGIAYHFTVLDSPVINAFALPGGYVYVTRGVLAQMNSEAELALVLGHEISHVAAKHGAERLSQQQGMAILNIGAQLLFGKKDLGLAADLANGVAGLALTGYGRNHEFEADLIGLKYAFKAGYNPVKATRFLNTLKRQETQQATWMQSMLATHPPTDERIARAQQKTKQLLASPNKEVVALMVNEAVLLDRLDNIVLSDAKNAGSFKEGRYQNLVYACQFSLPKTWKMTAPLTESVVEFSPPQFGVPEDAHLAGSLDVFTISGAESLTQVARKFEQDQKITLGESAPLLHSDGLTLKYVFNQRPMLLTYFKHKNYAYALAITGTNLDMQNNAQVIRDIASSFTFLSDTELKNQKFYRLKLHNVQSGETLDSIAKLYFSDSKKGAEKIAAFNDLDLQASPKTGSRVKIPGDE